MNAAVVRTLTSAVWTMSNKGRVVIGMSGGVDSSVAAALLKDDGYDVIGVTMRLWDGNGVCGSSEASDDAHRVCDMLGIKHCVSDMRDVFSKFVIDYFVSEYVSGKTPNPCIACNKFLKFDAMVEEAEKLNADFIATGHYAKIEYDKKSKRFLLKSVSSSKDQTYVLYNLTQTQLSRLLLPLGGFKDKDEVRRYAENRGLVTANKPDSQEICFIPDNDYSAFIERQTGIAPSEGNFVDTDGNVLGRHKGIVNYTVGQRKGLGIAFGEPMFVIRIDAEKNEVVLGRQGSEFSESLYAENPNFIAFDTPPTSFEAQAKIRYSAKPACCTVTVCGNRLFVKFDAPQRAVTPGQAVVFYNDDTVIGGATIIQKG